MLRTSRGVRQKFRRTRRQLRNSNVDRWNHARRGRVRAAPLSRGRKRILALGGNSGAATSSAGMHQSWCSDADRAPLREGTVQIRRSGGNFRAATPCARITPVVAPEACRALFREGAVQLRSIRGNSGIATLSARVTPDMVLDACCASLGR